MIPGAEPGPVPEALRQPPGPAQVAESELGAGNEQFGPFRASHTGTDVLAGKQSAMVEQVQPVERGESATAALALQG